MSLSLEKLKASSVNRPIKRSGFRATKGENLKDFLGRISIIMPAYNEGALVFAGIKETVKVLKQANCDYEIIVVDDGSQDNTHQEALRAQTEFKHVKVVKAPRNGGKGQAIIEGSKHVTGDIVTFLDADLDLHPEQINVLFDFMSAYNADIVIGSKRHPDSKLDYPWYRRVMSNVYYLLVKTLFGLPIKDTQTGIKLLRQEVLREVLPKLIVKKYAFDLELLVNAFYLGYKIEEAPVTIEFQGKFGRIKLKEILHTLIDTMGVFYRLRMIENYNNEKESELKEATNIEPID